VSATLATQAATISIQLSTIASESKTVTVSTTGPVNVNDTKNTGVSLQLNGVTQGAEVKVSIAQLNAPSQGEGQVQLSTGGTVKYYDVKVTSNSNSGTGTVCITDPSINASSQLAYYNGNSWVVLTATVNGNTICGQVPVASLGGTNFVVGTGFQALQTSTSTYYPSPSSTSPSSSTQGGGGGIPEFPIQLSAAFFLTMMVAVAYLAARRRMGVAGGSLS
jgi:hypothetical protein